MSTTVDTVTLNEVNKHNNADSCWIVVQDKVYDVTKFVEEHPGGPEVLLYNGGRICTEAFKEIGHSGDAIAKMANYEIGVLPDFESMPEYKSPQSENQQESSNNNTWVITGSVFAGVVACGVLAYKRFS